MIYEVPNSTGTKVHFKDRYENYINGKWTAPAGGEYFENTSPLNGKVLCEVARSTKEDVELALDSAHAAFGGYKMSGIGRENHKMMLNHYQRTKNMLVSYSEQKLGFF